MINVYSFNAVSQAMALAKAKNLKVVTVHNSPVELLNRAASGPSIYNASITDEEFYHRLPDELKIGAILGEGKEAAFVQEGGHAGLVPMSEHELTMNELVRMASQRVAGMLDFARNVAQPFVRAVLDQMQEPQQTEVTEEWTLIPVGLDDAFDAPVVQGLLKTVANPQSMGYDYEPMSDIVLPAELPVPQTGSKAYDDVLAKLLNELQATPLQIMRDALDGTGENPYRPLAFQQVKMHVAAMLLAAFYLENPWAESGVSANKWTTQMSRLQTGQIAWLTAFLNQLNDRIRAGNTVLSIDGDGMKVYVCQEVFSTFVERGGCPEALLGAIYIQEGEDGGSASTNIDSLLENMDSLVGAWSRRSAVSKAALDTDWVNNHRTGLKNAFYQQIGATEDGLLGTSIADARKASAEAIDKCFGRQVEDITAFVIDIAGKEVFNDAGVARILLAIHRGMKDGIEPDVAARDETVEYVLDWVLGSLYVE